MYYNSLDYLDRLRAKNIFKGTYITCLGVLGSLILLAATLAFYVPTITGFFQGSIYFQSEFSLHQTPFGNITIPRDFRTALVFYNKTDNSIANHTLLRQLMSVVTYQMSSTSRTIKSDTILSSCDPNYFQNTINPPQNFNDCILFANNSKVDITYLPDTGYVSFGFYSFAFCQDPFNCLTNSAFRNATVNNFSNVFNNFTYTLFFTSRVLQPDATYKDQVFALSSSNFNTPFTITSDAYGEIQIRNTTMDDSLLPWYNYKTRTGPAWYGTMSSTPKNATTTSTAGVRNGFIASRFQNQVYRYYKKIDWLMGIIGGAMFLFFIVLYLPIYFINQWQKQGELISEFFVRHRINVNDENGTSDQSKLVFFGGNVHLQKVEQSRLYFLKKLLPWYESRQEREFKQAIDIARLIKMIKVAERNLKNQSIELYEQPRKLKIAINNQSEPQERHVVALPDTSQIGQQLGVQNHIQQNLIINDVPQPAYQINGEPQKIERRSQVQVKEKQGQNDIAEAQEKGREQSQFTEQRLALRSQIDPQTIEKYSKFLGMHPQVMSAAIKSDNTSQLVNVNPTLMALANKQEEYQFACQVYRYSRQVRSRESFSSKVVSYFFKFVRFFDIYGVQPQFGLHSAGSSIFGCLMTLFIVGCAVLFFIFIILNAKNYQTYVQYDFQDGQQINYNLVTGVGFRPFFCVNSFGAYNALSSTTPTIQLTFFANNGSQRTIIPMTSLGANMHSYLGIAADSSYTTINTNYCWVMQDNFTIPMGGYNTSNQAYFGFRFDPICSGTVAFCQSISSTLRTRIVSYLSMSSYTFTLYMPFNTFDPQTKTLSGGGVHPQTIREGTSGIVINGGTVQNFYVNSIQLIDDYSMRFMDTQNPPVLQQSITTDRYQLGSNTHGVEASMPFYEVRVRPSGQLTKVVLTGTPTDVVLGVIGGICVIFYAVFHCFGKAYGHYNARCELANLVYGEQANQSSFLHKLLVLLLPECLCRCLSEQTSQRVLKDKQVDRIIQYQLNHSELIKQSFAVYQLSTAGFASQVQKFLGLIYFKQPVSQDFLNEPPQEPINKIVAQAGQFVGLEEEHESVHSDSQAQMHRHQHGVANLQAEVVQNKQIPNQYDSIDGQAQKIKEMFDEVQPYNPHRSPYAQKQSNKLVQFMDWFSTKPSFTLNGERRIRSVFGSCIFFGMAASIIVLVLYQLRAYTSGSNSRISFQKYMISDISNEPGFVLNSSNFRLALGFHRNPNVSLVNVSTLLNSTSNLVITVSQINLIRNSNNVLSQSETAYQLIPCPSTYFDSFKDRNTDYTFLSNLTFAWCLPLNLSLNLTPISTRNVMQYLTMRIINITNDTATLNNLRTLTSTYTVGLYMTIPQIDLSSKSFKYSVKQIRGFARPTSSSMEYNVTLTKQQIVYTTPNYTLNPPQTVVSNYIYLRNNERTVIASNTSLPRIYNITFSYLGMVEKYVYMQPNANEIVGVIGGLIALFYAVALFIAQSFNMYKYKYLLGKQLYLIRQAQVPLERERKKELVDDQLFLQRQKDLDYEIELNELQLLWYWLLSFFFCNCHCSKRLTMVTILQHKAEEVLNLGEFFVKTAKLKDTLNKKYFLQANNKVKVTNLFSKLPILEQQSPFQLEQSHKVYLRKHGLSSFDQYILSLAQKQEQSFENVFKDKSMFRNIYLQLEGSSQTQNRGQMKKEKQSNSQELADPELRPQTTKYEATPMDSFSDLKPLQTDALPLQREEQVQQIEGIEREEQFKPIEDKEPIKQESNDFVMIDNQQQQKAEIADKQEISKIGEQFSMLDKEDSK